MFKFISFISCFLLLSAPCCGGEEEIVVRLGRASSLQPLYLDALTTAHSGFEHGYIASLEKVLRFDLNHNGKTVVVERRPEWLKLCKEENGIKTFIAEKWEEAKIHAVVKGE